MHFALVMLATMYIGRKLGWFASRRVFYLETGPTLWLFLLMWGNAISWIVRVSADAAHPSAWTRWILGYALGAYIAVPNYGLFVESTLPIEDFGRHRLIASVPLLTYVVSSALLAAPWLAPLSTELIIIQWFLFAAAGYWVASRDRRLWRAVGIAVAVAFTLNAIISLVDLALIGDPLPGGLPSLPGADPTHAQAMGEYGGTTLSLICGWVGGKHQRLARQATLLVTAPVP